jgi:DNA primase
MGKNLSVTQAYLLSRTRAQEICLCLDGGEKERAQAAQNAARLQEIYDGRITIMNLPDGVDPDDCDNETFFTCFTNRFSFDDLGLTIRDNQERSEEAS